MKKIFLVGCLLTVISSFAQGRIAEKVQATHAKRAMVPTHRVFTPLAKKPYLSAEQARVGATYLTLSQDHFKQLQQERSNSIELVVPYNGKDLILQLYKDTLFTNGFSVKTNTSKKPVVDTQGVFYKGIIKGDVTSVVSINVFKDQINGLIASKQKDFGNLVLAKQVSDPSSKQAKSATSYLVYSDANLKQDTEGVCQTQGNDISLPKGMLQKPVANAATKCVSVYVEIDYDIFTQNNSDITQTTNWALSVFNHSQTLYTNDGISIRLESIKIWDTPDPYQGSSSVQNVTAFRNYTPSYTGDVALLISQDPGGLGGVALGIGTMCTPNSYCYADVDVYYNQFPTYSWTVGVVAHELGHVLGSPHTHSCVWNGNNTAIDNCGPMAFPGYGGDACVTDPPLLPYQEKGTIMSYCHGIGSIGISFANGFGPQPRTAIQNRINASSCLAETCDTTPLVLTADFEPSTTTVCLGDTVSFTDTSTGNPTYWSWVFQGGTPEMSTEQNPVVTYNTPGVYAVMLQVSNEQETDVVQRLSYIQVGQNTSVMPSEDFQGDFPIANWSISNPDNYLTWEKRSDVGNGDTSCMVMNNADNAVAGEQDSVRLPYYDFSALNNAALYFDVAYTQFDAFSPDVLKVQVSTDCGTTWTDAYSKTHTELETVSVPTQDSNAWVPTLPSHWRREMVDLKAYDGNPNVSIRFLNISGYGTRIWIDNLSIENAGVLSTQNTDAILDVSLYPNPSTGVFFLDLPMAYKDYQVTIYNMLGQVVHQEAFSKETNHVQRIAFSPKQQGLYFVKIASKDVSSVLKLQIQ